MAVRHVRRDGLDILKKQLKDHAISEDDEKRHETEVQKATDTAIAEAGSGARPEGKGNHAGLAGDRHGRKDARGSGHLSAARPGIAAQRPREPMSDSDTRSAVEAKTEPQSLRRADAPAHVGIIMDGNGRWAAQRSLPRFEGHRRGVEALRRTVRAAIDLGIGYLTVYSFSSENWTRPEGRGARPDGPAEALHPQRSGRSARQQRARPHHRRTRERLPSDIGPLLTEAEEVTRDNRGLDADRRLQLRRPTGDRRGGARARGRTPPPGVSIRRAIDADMFERRLSTAGLPDPDLVIRTSGEQRLSNFLPWQAAYAEFVFLPVLWPDFDKSSFEEALAEYSRRERRFGGLGVAAPSRRRQPRDRAAGASGGETAAQPSAGRQFRRPEGRASCRRS